nr:hypothetical protein [Arthrospira sp. SH-MAG29]
MQHQLKTGERQTVKYQDYATINQGDLFILDGQKFWVAETGEILISDYGLKNYRLRVIYDNDTESNPLFSSCQRPLNKDKTSRITKLNLCPLFSSQAEPKIDPKDDLTTTGYIYVLRSKSEHPFMVANRSIIHQNLE